MSEVIMTASGKGGTGKSMFAANLGATLAKKGFKTIIVDMDLGMRNMDMYLGMEDRIVYNIIDVFAGTCKISRAVIQDRQLPNLALMAASPENEAKKVTPIHMQVLCNRLKKEYDYIIIDTPTETGDFLGNIAVAADKAIIVTEPEPAAIRGAESTDEFLSGFGIEERYIVMNKIRPDLIAQKLMPSLGECVERFRIPLLGGLQYDDNIYVFTSKGIPIILKEGTYIEESFNNIAQTLIDAREA